VAAEGLVKQEGPEGVDGLRDGLVGGDDSEPGRHRGGRDEGAAGDFPQLSAIYAEGDRSAGPPMTEGALTEQFERGLAALLDGLAARMNV